MVFSSSVFLFLFLPIIILLYFFPLHKWVDIRKYRNFILLLASIVFYWWGESTFLIIMLLSIVINWMFGLWIDKDRTHVKCYVILATIYNIGILFIYKYLGFFTENIADIVHDDSIIVEIGLPIGISFFTFQMLSYVYDVAGNTAKCQNNLLNVALYAMMFPQLVAGPIVRYQTIADEIEDRKESLDEFSDGMCRFVVGLGKKVVIANNLGLVVDLVFDGVTTEISVLTAWIGAIGYTLQIYYDFSAYSDMAIGLGRMFGFHYLENFNYPYISKSISGFWRRWHISMGTWFRDYLYFPLGGSRVNRKWKIYRNLMVVWLFTGIWHGANWTFIVWGIMHGVLICLEKFFEIEKHIGKSKVFECLTYICTLFFVIVGWVIFRADSLDAASTYLKAMFGMTGNVLLDNGIRLLEQFWVFFILGMWFSIPHKKSNSKRNDVLYVIGMLVVFEVTLIYVVKGGYNPFIYFNF